MHVRGFPFCAFCFAVVVIVTNETLLVAAAGPSQPSKAEAELRSAIKGAAKGNKKVAAARLKRALEAAQDAEPTVPAELLAEAANTLKGSSEADAKTKASRAALEEALETGGAAELARALSLAKEAGLPPKQPDVIKAEEALAELEKERKRTEKREAKRAKLWRELADAAGRDEPDASVLRVAIDVARGALAGAAASVQEEELLVLAEKQIAVAEWNALPAKVRLDRTSSKFGRDKCSPAKDPLIGLGMCRNLEKDALLEMSRKVGEKNCDHPTLTDGAEAPHPTPLPAETARHFCKYPPPFDLVDADEKGVRPTEFEFPKNILNQTMLQEEGFAESVVLNMDMDYFRSHVAPCGAKQLWLIEFYVHWCPHCMSVMPKLYKLAIALRNNGSPIRVGAVNCASQKELCGVFQIMGHPMIAFFYGGVRQDGGVDLFQYTGSDVRVNSALDSIKQNRNPAWDAGAPKDLYLPKHVFPAEAAQDLVQLLPEEYRPSLKAQKWLANSSKTTATACHDVRKWYAPRRAAQALAEPDEPEAGRAAGQGERKGKKDKKEKEHFPGDGWPIYEHGSTPAHRIQDAAEALVYVLEQWVKPNTAGESPHAFAYGELQDLHSWVQLLASNFPGNAEGFHVELGPELHDLRRQLVAKIEEVETARGSQALCEEEWRQLVKPLRKAFDAARIAGGQTKGPQGEGEDAPQEIRWRPSLCRTETCRVWMLLHVISVAPLARLADGEAQTCSSTTCSTESGNENAFDAMIAVLRRYFTCRTCRSHFLQAVEAGSFGLEAARAGGFKDLALWWWRMHSDASTRIAREGKCKSDRRWPSADVCDSCWNATSVAQFSGKAALAAATEFEDAVATELVRQYWPRDIEEGGEADEDAEGEGQPGERQLGEDEQEWDRATVSMEGPE